MYNKRIIFLLTLVYFLVDFDSSFIFTEVVYMI